MAMNINAATAKRIAQIGLDQAKSHQIQTGPTNGPSFGDVLTKAIGQVSDAQDNAADHAARFMRGEPVELHQVMAATEEAGISLEMMIEVRNKFTEAYRAVINMQG
jgi:flagellar hook-basal body complex protein FliE